MSPRRIPLSSRPLDFLYFVFLVRISGGADEILENLTELPK